MKDKNGIELSDGDIIDIHQTVNGQNLFIVMSISPLDIRYNFDINYRYEYDCDSLLIASDPFDDTPYFEVVGNIYKDQFSECNVKFDNSDQIKHTENKIPNILHDIDVKWLLHKYGPEECFQLACELQNIIREDLDQAMEMSNELL